MTSCVDVLCYCTSPDALTCPSPPSYILAGCFVICWTPGLVVLLLDGLGCEKCQVLRYEKYCLVLAECNSFVNPIIYCFRDKDMRRTFKQILCCVFRRGGGGSSDGASAHFTTLDQEVLSESNGGDSDHKKPITHSRDFRR